MYNHIQTNATYSPWLEDKEFNSIFEVIVNGYTMVDKYRCWELWDLLSEVSKLNGAIIEVGCWNGGTASLIAKRAKLLNIKDIVYFADTFKGVVKAGEFDPYYKNGKHNDSDKAKVLKLISILGLDNARILEGIFPEEINLKENIFRFAHIDVDTYQSGRDAFTWIWEKLVVNGIIVFDDYGFNGNQGITKLVNEYKGDIDKIIVYNLNGHAIIIKK